MKKPVVLLCTFYYAISSFAQLPVSTSAQNKNVLLEEYTGIHCTYCPDGAKMAEEIHEKNPDDVYLITWHFGTARSSSSQVGIIF